MPNLWGQNDQAFFGKKGSTEFLGVTLKNHKKQAIFATMKKSKPVTEDIFISELFSLKADKPKQGHLADKQ